jgi:hypothetical protein
MVAAANRKHTRRDETRIKKWGTKYFVNTPYSIDPVAFLLPAFHLFWEDFVSIFELPHKLKQEQETFFFFLLGSRF